MLPIQFEFKRFWVRFGESIRSLDGGFLPDPDDEFGRQLNPSVCVTEELSRHECLALLGEPGSGKSRGLLALRTYETEKGAAILYVDLRSFSSDHALRSAIFEAPEFSVWRAGETHLTLYLDSLDECLIHVRTVAAIILDGLRGAFTRDGPSLRLRIACRSAEWPPLLARGLGELWEGADTFATFELAPLRSMDVKLAAQAAGVRPTEFLAAIRTHDAEAFALRPLTLRFLLSAFTEPGGVPQTADALYLAGCRELAREHSLSRKSSASQYLGVDERIRIAERLAAFSLICRRPTFYLGEDECEISTQDLWARHIYASQDTGDDSDQPAPNRHINEVLQTALFTSAGTERVGWTHWAVPEFLAARFLTRQLDITRQLELLTIPDSTGKHQVVPQLRELTTWAATCNPALAEALVELDASVLLNGKPLDHSPQSRSRIVESLLRQINEGTLEYSRLDLRGTARALNHSGLEEQLARSISNPTANPGQRAAALNIAGECGVAGLASAVLEVALARSEAPSLRRVAVSAWVKLGPKSEWFRLIPLLTLSESDDPQDDLKGDVLRVLWPSVISITELIGCLTPPRRTNYFGSYQHFILGTFAEFPLDGIPVALRWLATNGWALEQLSDHLVDRALQNLSHPDVPQSLAQVLLARLRRHIPLLQATHEKPAGQQPEFAPEVRRSLLIAIASLSSEQEDALLTYRLRQSGLISKSDIPWLLSQSVAAAPNSSDSLRWARWVDAVVDWTSSDQLDSVLAAWDFCGAVRDTFAYLQPVDLDSAGARQRRQDRNMRVLQPRHEVLHPSAPEMTRGCLERFATGETHAWWHLNMYLTLSSDSDQFGDETEVDLTRLPGWAELDSPLQESCLQMAEQYLRTANPQTSDWLGTDVLHRPAIAGYRALLLLLRFRPSLLSQLPNDIWAHWTATVVVYGRLDRHSQETHCQLLRFTERNAPNALAQAMLAEVDREDRQYKNVSHLHELSTPWPSPLIDGLLERLVKGQLSSSGTGDVLSYLLAQSNTRAQLLAIALAANLSQNHASALESATALLRHPSQRTWPLLWQIIQSNRTLGREAVLALNGFQDEAIASRLVASGRETFAADFFMFLSEEFPHAEDEKFDGVHYIDARAEAAHLRDTLFQRLVEKGTDGSARAVRDIIERLPYLKHTSWWRNAAEHARLQMKWNGLAPKELSRLFARAESHVVESEGHLLEVVLESLQRLEAIFHGETPSVRDVWNTDRTPTDEAHLSDVIKRHIQAELTGRRVVVNREVQIRSDQRTDIHVDAVLPSTRERVSVVIEVKGCWNPGVRKDMAGQLVGRYLKDNPRCAGIFVVGWFLCASWSRKDGRRKKTRNWSLEEARAYFEEQARALRGSGTQIAAVVLDTRWR